MQKRQIGPMQTRIFFYALMVCAIAVIIGGFLLSAFLYVLSDSNEKATLLRQAAMVASALDQDRIRNLKGSAADLQSPDYQYIKNKLREIRTANRDARFIYLAGYRDGQPYFFADSEPEDSEDYSPPGQIYDEAEPSFSEPFFTKRPVIEGIYPDRWGVWLTALVPIIASDGEVIAELGIDLDASAYRKNLIIKALPSALVGIFVGFLLVAYGVVRKREIGYLRALQKAKEGVDRKVVERTRELAEERARLIASLSSLSVGIVLSDTSGAITFKNEAICELLGITSQDRHLEEILGRLNSATNLAAAVQESMSKKTSIRIDDCVFENKFLRAYISPIFVAGGTQAIFGTVLLVEDITLPKRLERSKDEFLAIASHEMRTPLTIIQGNAELLLRPGGKNEKKKTQRMVTSIYNNSVRLMGIINDLLDVAMIEQGGVKFKKDQIDIMKVIREVADDFRSKAAEKKLSITITPARKRLPDIIADRDRVKEIVINFLANAIQFTDRGGVTISAEHVGQQVTVRFSDTGIGIKPEVQNELFQKLQSMQERFIRTSGYGSGLGLYINKRLAEAMSGSVALERSAEGVGSVFSCTFPAAPRK
jgi:signal transduction histidine kinase